MREFEDPAELERLRKACEVMLPQQAAQVLGWLDPTQRMSPVDQAENWGWDAVRRALETDRTADEIPW